MTKQIANGQLIHPLGKTNDHLVSPDTPAQTTNRQTEFNLCGLKPAHRTDQPDASNRFWNQDFS